MTVWRLAVASVIVLGGCATTPDGTSGPARSVSESPADGGSAPPRDPASPSVTGSPSTPAGPSGATYQASSQPIGAELRARMVHSHRHGCPVRLADLRYLQLGYVGFDGREHTGELVVHEDYAGPLIEVFRTLFEARWPIHRMQLVDDYGGDDQRSMAADNTSAYNCRRVAGSEAWSAHAYGAAVDLNPLENPYVTAESVQPPAGRPFAGIDRTGGAPVPRGAVRAGDVVVRAFAGIGWGWGGRWSSSKDYQHFSASGS